ncbi:hypothetical protein ACIP17_17490 [Streptomyces iakyrus]|uniref:Uncharacterized protein n=1 Tax=Streptomyces iakyrus TaxID=68219 RepID=A0ABW8F9C9_9ACTN
MGTASRLARQENQRIVEELGVGGEGIEWFGIVAMGIPPDTDLAKVQKLLDEGPETVGREEGCIATQWPAVFVD